MSLSIMQMHCRHFRYGFTYVYVCKISLFSDTWFGTEHATIFIKCVENKGILIHIFQEQDRTDDSFILIMQGSFF